MQQAWDWSVSARAHRVIASVSVVAAIVAGALTIGVGVTPWLFVIVAGSAAIVVLAPWLGWSSACWAAVAATLFIAQWVMVLNPLTGLRLDAAQVGAMLLALVASAVAATLPTGRRVYPRIRIADTISAVAPAAISGIVLVVAGWVRGGASVTWAMSGDAQYNTVLARIIAQEGGATSSNVDVIALAQGLMAMSHLPGRDAVAADDLLIHDIVRQADLWLLMILLSSVLGAAIAARLLAGAPTAMRLAGILGASAIPLSWHLTGNAISAGFYNVGLAYLVLELVVYFWLFTEDRPWLRTAVLTALTTVLLGAWTPLAVISVVLAGAAGIVALRRRPEAVSLVLFAASAVQLVAFGLIYILPTFISSGDALSQPGGIVGLPRIVVAAVAGLLIVLAVLLLVRRKGSPDSAFAWGSILFVGGTSIGIGFLYFQNRHLVDPWIYYPIKFSWIALEVMLVLIWIAILLLVRVGGVRRILALAALGLVAVAAVGIAVVAPPRDGNPVAYLPLTEIALDPPAVEDSLDILSEHAGEKVLFWRYTDGDDAFMNQWQFQLTVRSAGEPIRSFAYQTVDSPGDFCDAAQAWGGDVEVITADADWAAQLDAYCAEHLRAVLRPAPTG